MKAPARAPLAAAVLATLLLGGCAGTTEPRGASGDGSTRVTLQSATPEPGKVTTLLVVVEENHSLSQMKAGMPYAYGLAKKYGYARSYHALSHPSLPNYIGIASGRTYGIGDDADPAAHPLAGHTVFGQALAHGRSATVYAQGMPGRCATTSSGAYAVKHNPWAYFAQERAGCRRHDRRFAAFGPDVEAGSLPRVGMVVPDLDHDAHDGTLGQADAWFHRLMTNVFAGPDWQSGHLAVVLTADEDDGGHGNRVLTVVIHPSQSHHVVRRRLSHYSLTGLYDDVAGLPRLHRARTAPSMAEAFGLPVG